LSAGSALVNQNSPTTITTIVIVALEQQHVRLQRCATTLNDFFYITFSDNFFPLFFVVKTVKACFTDLKNKKLLKLSHHLRRPLPRRFRLWKTPATTVFDAKSHFEQNALL